MTYNYIHIACLPASIKSIKVSKSQKHFFLKLHCPNFFLYLTRFCPSFIGQNFVKYFVWCLGNGVSINCFWDLLNFNFRLIITIIPIPIKSVWELFQLICNCFKSDMPIKHRNCGINSNSTTNQLIRKILLCINYVLLFVIIEPRLKAKRGTAWQKAI